jgi:hypothetical protein
MKLFAKGLMGAAFAGIAAYAALAPAIANTATAPVTVKWSAQSVIAMTLTPNYVAGYGAVPAVIGTQPTPTTGPNATLGGGAIDFGDVLGGKNYLYKYAAHLHITSNDTNGFYLYGEGAADFYNTADASTQPLDTTLYYLNSTSGSPPDGNTGFSAGLPFFKTSYLSYPSPIDTSATESADLYYDYQLKVPATATGGLYYVWIVYTVVAR